MGENYARPKFCVCEQCKPIISTGSSDENFKDGGSVICLGENSAAEVWKASKTTHINDICFCIYTPFKGWIRNVMNNDDLSIISCLIRWFSQKTKREITLAGADHVSKIDFSREKGEIL